MADADRRQTLLVRVDASPAIGVGHAMRCLALAQAWHDSGGEAHFAMSESNDAIRRRILQENFSFHAMQVVAGSLEDADACACLARTLRVDWILADGYRFGRQYFARLRSGAKHIAAIDDAGLVDCQSADVVINQNLHADQVSYSHADCALLGTQYTLLRREFRQMSPYRRSVRGNGPLNVIVALGGSDPRNFTAEIASAVLKSGIACNLTLIAGPANENANHLAEQFRSSATVLCDVSDVTPHFAAADIAISSGGSAVWEFAFFRTPMIICAQVDVEERLAARLAAAGGCLYVGPLDECAPMHIVNRLQELDRNRAELQRLGDRAGEFIDGLGANRVATIMMQRENISP